jgi:hypothetical protein
MSNMCASDVWTNKTRMTKVAESASGRRFRANTGDIGPVHPDFCRARQTKPICPSAGMNVTDCKERTYEHNLRGGRLEKQSQFWAWVCLACLGDETWDARGRPGEEFDAGCIDKGGAGGSIGIPLSALSSFLGTGGTNMRAVCAGMLLIAVGVAGCASSSGESYAAAGYNFANLDKVAIVEVTGRVYGDAAKNQIANLFTMELVKKGYTVVERSHIKEILKEQEFQSSDLTSPEGRAKVKEIFNVPAILVIDIPKYDNEKLNMSAKLLDVQTGEVLWIGSGEGSTGRTAATIVGAIGGAALGAAVGGHDTGDRVAGGVIGGVVGGVAGNMLSPDQVKVVRKVVAKVAASLPPRIPQVQTKK